MSGLLWFLLGPSCALHCPHRPFSTVQQSARLQRALAVPLAFQTALSGWRGCLLSLGLFQLCPWLASPRACLSSPNLAGSGLGRGRRVTPRGGQQEGLRIRRRDEHDGPVAATTFLRRSLRPTWWCPGPWGTEMEQPWPPIPALRSQGAGCWLGLSRGSAVVCPEDGH